MSTHFQDSIRKGRAANRVKVVCDDGHDELTVSTWFYSPGSTYRRWNVDQNPVVHYGGDRWYDECHPAQRLGDEATNPRCRTWMLDNYADRRDRVASRTGSRHILDHLRCPRCGRDKQMAGGEQWESFLDRLIAADIHEVSLRVVERMV